MLCRIDGCEKEGRGNGEDICGMHYHRFYRFGTYELTAKPAKQRYITSNGYIKVHKPGHPLSDSTRYVFEHRFIYHEKYGEGPFNCYWCEKIVTWDMLNIDHLDEDTQNNNLDNIKATCPGCNTSRGIEKKLDNWREKHGIEFNGVIKTKAEWARSIGITPEALCTRLQLWSLEEALTRPKGNSGPKPRVA